METDGLGARKSSTATASTQVFILRIIVLHQSCGLNDLGSRPVVNFLHNLEWNVRLEGSILQLSSGRRACYLSLLPESTIYGSAVRNNHQSSGIL